VNANPPGETRDETVSQGGGPSVSLSGGVEQRKPESQTSSCPVATVLHADTGGAASPEADNIDVGPVNPDDLQKEMFDKPDEPF
jgi:hypothetical protein